MRVTVGEPLISVAGVWLAVAAGKVATVPVTETRLPMAGGGWRLGAGEDVDAFGGERIAVGSQGLDEEAVGEDRGDDAGRRDFLTDVGRDGGGGGGFDTLNVVDLEVGRRLAESGECGEDQETKGRGDTA